MENPSNPCTVLERLLRHDEERLVRGSLPPARHRTARVGLSDVWLERHAEAVFVTTIF
jgi:hypothetical protein